MNPKSQSPPATLTPVPEFGRYGKSPKIEIKIKLRFKTAGWVIFLIFSEDTILNFSIRAFKWCIAQIKIRETRFLVAILRRYPVWDLRAEAATIGPRALYLRGVVILSVMLPN